MHTREVTQRATSSYSLRAVPAGAWGVLFLSLAVQVLFLQKPVHVDDPVVLHIARLILKEPLRPFAGELDWDGWMKPTFYVTTNPPLLSYYLALWMLVGGEREWLLHLAMLIWQPMLWWGIVLLAWRFGMSSAWASALVLLNPAAIVSPNLMRDVPMVALWTLGTAWFVMGSDRGDAKLLGWGAWTAGCAALMKYSGLGAPVLLAVYLLLQKRLRQMGWITLAMLPFALWCLHNLLVDGQVHFWATLRRAEIVTPWSDRLWGTLAGMGGVWLLWLWAAWSVGQWRTLVLGGVVALAMGWWRWHRFDPAGDLEAALWCASGVFLLVLTLFRAWERRREQAFLSLWAVWVLLAIGIGAPFAAARHLLPALTPVTLLWLSRQIVSTSRVVLSVVIAAQASFGIYAGWCDVQIAEVYRQGARQVKSQGAQAFIGHWGWMYYAQRVGLQQVSANRLPATGSLVAIPSVGGDAVVPPTLAPRLVYEQSVEVEAPSRLATLPPRAGFYAALRGAPPFRWLPEGYREQFDLFRVEGASR